MLFVFLIEALRTNEGNEAQVCIFIIHLLMLKPPEFRNRIAEFVKENSPEHWKQSNWYYTSCFIFSIFDNVILEFPQKNSFVNYRHDKHKTFHNKFPEIFVFEDQPQNQLPVFFGNVCLRFLPVIICL